MGSKGRIPPHVRRPVPGPAMINHDPFGPTVLPPPGPFSPFDMLPHREILEQKLAAQHVEIQRLATENQRLAATHGTLRQDLAAAQHELQILHTHIGVVKSEREQQMRGLMKRIAEMENELKTAEPLKSELQQVRTEADKLLVARQELMSKVHQLTQDLHRAHTDVQQIPVLMSELEGLRQEYQRCRVSYDYEKKLFSDHLESLQAMEKNYATMAREVEKLRLELHNTSSTEMRPAAITGGPYGGASGNMESEASGRHTRQNIYEDGYHQGQGHAPVPGNAGSAAAAANASVGASTGTVVGTPTYTGAQSVSAPAKPPNAPRGPGYEPTKVAGYDAQSGQGYDPQRVSGYDPQRVTGYDPSRGPSYDPLWIPGYDPQRITSYDPQRIPSYDPQRIPGYDMQRPPGNDAPRGPGYDVPRGPGYDAQRGLQYDVSRGAGYDGGSRGTAGPHGQLVPANNVPYGSATPPAPPVGGYEAPARGGNQARR